MLFVHHDDEAFCIAYALIVALEERGLDWLSPDALLLLGEARAELTDFDSRRPTRWLHLSPESAAEALTDLERVLEQLVTASDSGGLAAVLPATRVRDLVRDAAAS